MFPLGGRKLPCILRPVITYGWWSALLCLSFTPTLSIENKYEAPCQPYGPLSSSLPLKSHLFRIPTEGPWKCPASVTHIASERRMSPPNLARWMHWHWTIRCSIALQSSQQPIHVSYVVLSRMIANVILSSEVASQLGPEKKMTCLLLLLQRSAKDYCTPGK